MDKISSEQASQLLKTAAPVLRALSEENVKLRDENGELQEKVASFEKKARAEKIAAQMEAKGINTDQSLEEKIAAILNHENLDVLEEAVGFSAPQMKLASVHDDSVEVEHTGDDSVGEKAAQNFASALATLE